ncbi:AEL269Cp [Eremothecium gossypii ATCC 10895]|uniref:AEL269Cp n=1 Tax=Eremothecium gossypii (strain ATCC 10895 / CBS 109.51 / FGSC 9923 / NRRL Y-1056) TaxID=284811 RepID=Q758V7_EREGS|nr:AEL269Cp [Eremothecium gossypii ATCC 10895]AAS52415.1 AEL269Cp [Eremothecium gossypii ATCC 10895]
MVELHEIRVDHDHLIGDKGETVADVLNRQEFSKERFVPTLDEDVRAALRLLDKPEEIPEEDNHDRRERLAELLSSDKQLQKRIEESGFLKRASPGEVSDGDELDEEFYTPASRELVEVRKFLVGYSLDCAARRLAAQRARQGLGVKAYLQQRRAEGKRLATFELVGSQLVADKHVSQVAVHRDGQQLATGCWGGSIKVVSCETLGIAKSIDAAHEGKIGGLDWHPDGNHLLSGGGDNLVKLWDMTSNSFEELRGHAGRVSRVKVHPSGRLAASASFDLTWILWDLERKVELQLQEGHSKAVYTIAFQSDGALLASAGLDAVCAIWDLRSGEPIMKLEGHAGAISGVDWSPNGYQLATAGADGTVRVWDIRNVGTESALLAHQVAALDVKFKKNNGTFLVSCGHDRLVNIFNADNWQKLASLEGHTDRVFTVDITEDGSTIYSGGKDRSLKQWCAK